MANLTIEVSDVVARRLEALAGASGKSVQELSHEALDTFAGSFSSRRTILKARKVSGGTSLADLGWLDGYAGQSVDQLLMFESTSGAYSVLAALEEAIQAKQKELGRMKITGLEFMVLSVMALIREVNNGGYHQFFLNSSRQFAPRVVNDLVHVGCTDVADITQEALDALKLPQVTMAAIEEAIVKTDENLMRKLSRMDTAFYRIGGIPERLLQHVRAHPNGIKI